MNRPTGTARCARGCLIRGRHLDGCDVAECPGCLPAMAAPGLVVCERDAARLQHALSAAPGVVSHLRDNLEPGAQVYDGDMPRGGERNPPAPLNVEALAAADDLHAELCSWVLLIMEERHLDGPGWHGTDIRPASKRRIDGQMVYEEARVVGVKSAPATVAVVQWLFTHLEYALQQPWAAPLADEIPEKVRTLQFRFPTEQRPVYLPVPCPGCKSMTLRRYPPAFQGAPVTVKCDMVDCDHVIAEEGFTWAAKVLAEQRGRTA